MGNIFHQGKTIAPVWSEHLSDLMKIWLYLDGPKGIMEYLEGGGKVVSPHMHDCEICVRLFSDKKYIALISNLSEGKVNDILMRYHLKCIDRNKKTQNLRRNNLYNNKNNENTK